MTFCPERAIEKERLEANRDLKMTVERLAVTHGPRAVLHNLHYAKLFATSREAFGKRHGHFCRYVFEYDYKIMNTKNKQKHDHFMND